MSKTADIGELREQFLEAFEGANYPVNNPMDLLPALPNGPATTFESGDFSMSVMEMQNIDVEDIDTDPEFPYESVEGLVDDLMEGVEAYLEQEGYELQR
jgi:hypothetical protein